MIDGQVTVPQASGTGQKARPNGAGGGGDKDGVRTGRVEISNAVWTKTAQPHTHDATL